MLHIAVIIDYQGSFFIFQREIDTFLYFLEKKCKTVVPIYDIEFLKNGLLAQIDDDVIPLIISDCATNKWYDGSIVENLYKPLILMPLLPQRMWQGTGIGIGLRVNLKMEEDYLISDEDGYLKNSDIPIGNKVPIVHWDTPTKIIKNIKNFFVKKGYWLPGVIFPIINNEIEEVDKKEIPPMKRIERFKALASPIAQHLAFLLAKESVEMTRSLISERNHAVFNNTTATHVAEIYFGGILKYKDKDTFMFHDGIADILLRMN